MPCNKRFDDIVSVGHERFEAAADDKQNTTKVGGGYRRVVSSERLLMRGFWSAFARQSRVPNETGPKPPLSETRLR